MCWRETLALLKKLGHAVLENFSTDLLVIELAKTSIEQFSIGCRKTKTKVITLANHKGLRAIHCLIKTRSNYTKLRKTCASKSGLVLVLLVIGFGFTSDWSRKWQEFFKPIPKAKVNANYFWHSRENSLTAEGGRTAINKSVLRINILGVQGLFEIKTA